jgi:hypothetical protein
LTAYLATYSEVWNCLTEEHRHEVGEDTGGCYNCALEHLSREMTEFETMTLDWHLENVNKFAVDCGLVRDAFRELGLEGAARRIFLLAQERIRSTFEHVGMEKARKQAELERVSG